MRWLFRLARTHPWATGIAIFSICTVLPLIVGVWADSAHWRQLHLPANTPDGWTSILDHGTIVTGWLSIAAAWALGVLAWARRKEVSLHFQNAGAELHDLEGTFEASLILGSVHNQPEWHLRHLKPRYAEILWTDATRENTGALIERFGGECQFLSNTAVASNRLENPYDINETRELCLRMLHGLKSKVGEKGRICVDLTAGTALMTIGAFQAAEAFGVTALYLVGSTPRGGSRIIDAKRCERADEARVVIVSDHRPEATQ